MKPILTIEGVSKKFTLNHLGAPYFSFRDRLMHPFKNTHKEEFWALKDVSFDVQRGDSIGIIGKNGAGKSTLLKILSRITPPTKGRVVCRGRVASLLEVGTGFHQELTGRENIFMNGSILGMKRREIKQRFDEIVTFSGTEKFLDMQLKHYSSGMQLRLAFAVAAHLDPEIMILDEVLAVGDASFQRKCFQKMEDINSSGRTIILVSHNMTQVKQLCKKGLLLDQGKVLYSGDMQQAIAVYLSNSIRNNTIDIDSLPRAGIKSDDIRIKSLRMHNVSNEMKIREDSEITFELEYEVYDLINELVMGFSLTDFYGNNIIECRSTSTEKKLRMEPGCYKTEVNFKLCIGSGTYGLNVGARSDKGHLEYIPSVATLDVFSDDLVSEEWNKPSAGIVSVPSHWKFVKN